MLLSRLFLYHFVRVIFCSLFLGKSHVEFFQKKSQMSQIGLCAWFLVCCLCDILFKKGTKGTIVTYYWCDFFSLWLFHLRLSHLETLINTCIVINVPFVIFFSQFIIKREMKIYGFSKKIIILLLIWRKICVSAQLSYHFACFCMLYLVYLSDNQKRYGNNKNWN